MSNKVEPIDTLAEALRKSCGLFNQLVKANTDLLKLKSPDRPIKHSIKGADGIRRPLTEAQAVALHEEKIDDQAVVIHGIEHDFLATIKDTDRAIKQHNLAGALGRSMSEPEEWLDELLAEIECMQAAALYPYYPKKNDSASQWGVMTPERRMGDLVAVQKRLHRLDVMLARRSRLTPAGTEDAADYKPGQWFTNETNIPLSRLRMAAKRDTKHVRTITHNGVVLYSAADARRWWPGDMVKKK